MGRSRPLIERFLDFAFPEPNTGCWLWIGAIDRQTGYGKIGTKPNRVESAHRVAWQLFYGKIPEGLWILHNCDIRRCVNPTHLYLGTILENSRDLMERGKPFCFQLRKFITPIVEQKRVANLPRGRKHHRSVAKLTEEQVRKILCMTGPQKAIAEKFSVCQQLISKIKRRRYWQHVEI